MRSLFLALLLTVPAALAQVPAPVVQPADTTGIAGDGEVPTDVPKELTFVGYSFTRATASNVTPTNDLLQGQVIGRLFGPNTTQTVDRVATYTEQRFVPFFVYRPRVLDGAATFRGLFKIDYTWGDQAYGVGNNRGGAISGGQINLQTLMANVDLRPSRRWNVVVGLQRMFDGARDPNVTPLDVFQQSGYKLAFWGTQGVGVSSYAQLTPATRGRLGVFQLWENQISRDDDVLLVMADVEHDAAPALELGADAWYLSDRARGAGGISVLGQGLNSLLAAYNGATRLNLPQNYTAHLGWVGLRASYNRGFAYARPVWADAFAIANVGVISRPGLSSADVFGVAANARIAYQYGRTANDHVAVEGLFTTGDADGADDGSVRSVITGNAYGSPAGIYTSGRALLLFPDAQVVNRYYSAVHDIGNQGYGVTGLFAHASYDLVPNRLTAKLGTAAAFATDAPVGDGAFGDGGSFMGAEVNAELTFQLKVFLELGLHAGYLALGDFYDGPAAVYCAPNADCDGSRPDDPWVVFTTLSWLMF
jgi:hypothetical protein